MKNTTISLHHDFPLVLTPVSTDTVFSDNNLMLSDAIIYMVASIGSTTSKSITSSSLDGLANGLLNVVSSSTGNGVILDTSSVDLSAASTAFTVNFTPTASTTNRYTLVLSYAGGFSKAIVVYATGFLNLVAIPETLDFGIVAVGQAITLPLTITNISPTPLLIKAILASDTALSEYAVSGITTDINLAVGSSANLNVTFTPAANNTRLATIRLLINDQPYLVALSGAGMDAQGYSSNEVSIVEPTIGVPVANTVYPSADTLAYCLYRNNSLLPFMVTSIINSRCTPLYPDILLNLVIPPRDEVSIAVNYGTGIDLVLNGIYLGT